MKFKKIFGILLFVVSMLAGSTKLHALDMAQQYPEHVCANGNIQHMIIWHNTLSQAAQHYGVSQSAILAANANIIHPRWIYMGNTMNIPCGTAARTIATVRNTRKALVVPVVESSPRAAITVNDFLNGFHHDQIALEAANSSDVLDLEPTLNAPLAVNVDLPTADSTHAVATLPLSLPQGWYSITVNASQAIVAGTFPALFLDKTGVDGKWKDRKKTGVKVVMNDDGTVTITTLFPKALTATSAIAFIAYDKKGNEVGRHYLTGDLLLKKVPLDEVRRLPASDFAKFDFGDRTIAGAYTNLLNTTFKKQPNKVVRFIRTDGALIAQNVVTVFVPALMIPTGIADAGFVVHKFEQRTQAQALQQVNDSQQVDQQ